MASKAAEDFADFHNKSVKPAPDAPGVGHNAKNQLKSFVERVEKLEEEKKAIADDIRDVYAEAKGVGYDTPALRAIVKRRKADKAKLAEHEAVVETYMVALGMI